MDAQTSDRIMFIGEVRTNLTRLDMCPKSADEGAPEGVIELLPQYGDALEGIKPGVKLLIFTWLHLADRTTHQVHPRGNPENPLTGVFYTHSPARPNPIGLHPVEVLGVKGCSLHVSAIEVLDRTPVIDIKSANGRPHTK